jgi:hypothetical protein
MTKWRTLVPRELTRRHQPADIHGAIFLPKDWPGHGPVVTLFLPECLTQHCDLLGSGDALNVVTRLRWNGDVNHWLRLICEEVRDEHAAIIFTCDTLEQAEDAAKAAAPLLPDDERIALERACAQASVQAAIN